MIHTRGFTLDELDTTLGGVIERLSPSSWYRPFAGGLGVYPANRAHGPFIHVDVRGYRARWTQ
jgi:hypothetical protein